MGWVKTQQLSQQGSHVAIGETPRLQAEQHQDAEQRLYTSISETQRRSPLSLHLDGPYHLLKRLFTDRAIMGNRLDVQKTSVGFKADLKAGRFLSCLPIPKSRGLLMVVSVRSARPSLWYCLMRELL